jgi:zinc protease
LTAIPKASLFWHEGIPRKILISSGLCHELSWAQRYASPDEECAKAWLTYGVGFGLSPMEHAGLDVGSLGTRNEKAGEALAVVKETLKKLADEGPTQAELDDVKTFLTGSYALRFDTNDKIAGQLLGILEEDLGIDYINKRNAMVEAITLTR